METEDSTLMWKRTKSLIEGCREGREEGWMAWLLLPQSHTKAQSSMALKQWLWNSDILGHLTTSYPVTVPPLPPKHPRENSVSQIGCGDLDRNFPHIDPCV